MPSLRVLLICAALILAVHCSCLSDCDECTQAKGAACWYNNWQRRDDRCGTEIGKDDDRRFSFEHPFGGRCNCCPPPASSEED
ncbi:hypothetical protein PRIPAC_88933 [Pristionchus pacificus]|uniref:Uncharacterized protein n=1 Tax=Pristionchus pacificus TaxID=54126 RepID=A0A2A6B5K7_PRIPA|nr:hypothetical protein PRIPAC_88933 [Pristionchus pacificus]|eukprot:PDM61175.1 hypothetical protein PRIPAC_50617 [Pristionchus pacificus]